MSWEQWLAALLWQVIKEAAVFLLTSDPFLKINRLQLIFRRDQQWWWIGREVFKTTVAVYVGKMRALGHMVG